MTELLLAAGADVSTVGPNLPEFELGDQDPAWLRQLGPNVRNLLGQTALHAAIESGNFSDTDFFEQLPSQELLQARDHSHQTMVHAAASTNKAHLRGLVREDYAVQDNMGQTPLLIAVAGPQWPLSFDELIQLSDVNHRAHDGRTALHFLSAHAGDNKANELHIATRLVVGAGARYAQHQHALLSFLACVPREEVKAAISSMMCSSIAFSLQKEPSNVSHKPHP